MKDRIYTLSNGLKVANFSSPHPFTFTDGTIIPAVENELSRKLMLNVSEQPYDQKINDTLTIQNVVIKFDLSKNVLEEMFEWQDLYNKGLVDIVLLPLPVFNLIKGQQVNPHAIMRTPFRVIRVADRITKTIHIDKFCI